jgi:hypothetical protein
MRQRSRQSEQWLEQINHLTEVSAWASAAAKELQRQVGKDPKLQVSLGSLNILLDEIQSSTERIWQLLCSNPAQKILAGKLMTEQEYFFWRARGCHLFTAEGLGLAQVGDYDVHRNLCYEDDQRYCYINPAPKPQDPNSKEVLSGIGLPPEELYLRDLRPEQRQFLGKYLLDVLRRFRTE